MPGLPFMLICTSTVAPGAALTLSTLIVAFFVSSAANTFAGSRETIITRTSSAEITLFKFFFIAFIPLFFI